MNITLGGYYVNNLGERCQLSIIMNPSFYQVEDMLHKIKDKQGVLSASYPVPDSELGESDLTMYSEKGMYLLLLPEIDQENNYHVRTLTIDCEDQLIEILGDKYSARTVTQNFDLVLKIFLDFCEKGNISQEILS